MKCHSIPQLEGIPSSHLLASHTPYYMYRWLCCERSASWYCGLCNLLVFLSVHKLWLKMRNNLTLGYMRFDGGVMRITRALLLPLPAAVARQVCFVTYALA